MNALIISVLVPGSFPYFYESLGELKQLLKTLSVEVLDTVVQKRPSVSPSTYAGKGFLKTLSEENDVDMLVFDCALTASQKNSIEELTGFQVFDRTDVILDIFHNHAGSHESKIQVELARLNIMLANLKGSNRKFSQQVGAIGVKGGKGERQIELDRRVIGRKITDLKKKLKKIERRRSLTMSARKGMVNVSLVGYTNAGKSTLMNTLTRSDVVSDDRLFVTLDTRSRKWFIDESLTVILSDTVGFIRNLPHQLVASFRSTFKVVEQSQIILMVVDISSEDIDNQLETTRDVIRDMDLNTIPSILVFNKIDRVDKEFLNRYRNCYPDAVCVSAKQHKGIGNLNIRVKQLKEEMCL